MWISLFYSSPLEITRKKVKKWQNPTTKRINNMYSLVNKGLFTFLTAGGGRTVRLKIDEDRSCGKRRTVRLNIYPLRFKDPTIHTKGTFKVFSPNFNFFDDDSYNSEFSFCRSLICLFSVLNHEIDAIDWVFFLLFAILFKGFSNPRYISRS